MNHSTFNRRDFCRGGAFGLAPLAAWWLMHQDRSFAEQVKPNLQAQSFSLDEQPPEKEPQAKAMISLFMQGGPSHIDLFDPKPELNRLNGEKFPRHHQVRQRSSGEFQSAGLSVEVPSAR